MALSYLFHYFGRDFWEFDIPFTCRLDRRRTETLLRLVEREINSPMTSSTGRLFDAVAALAGVREQVNYEAQAAIELEAALEEESKDASYPFEIRGDGGGWIIDPHPLFVALVRDLRDRVPRGVISRRFHWGFVDALVRTVEMVHGRSGFNQVCLSGGSFQNSFLLEHTRQHLEASGFQVFTHTEVPCGDGGLSLGQAFVAVHRRG